MSNKANVNENQAAQQAVLSPAAQLKIPRRILSALMTSLFAGVVPRSGAPYIAIGRKDEIEALLSDLEKTAEGGSAMRFIIGRYGSGKSFLYSLCADMPLNAVSSQQTPICRQNAAFVGQTAQALRHTAS